MIELKEKEQQTDERANENHFNNKWLFNNRWLHLVKLQNKRRNATHNINNDHVIHLGCCYCSYCWCCWIHRYLFPHVISCNRIGTAMQMRKKITEHSNKEEARSILCVCVSARIVHRIVYCCQKHTDRFSHCSSEYLVNFHYSFCIRWNCIWLSIVLWCMMHDDEHNKRFGNLRIDLLNKN